MVGILCCILIKKESHMDVRAAALAIVAISPLSFVFSLLISVGFPAGFSADGIHGHSAMGVPLFVSWSGIKDARVFYLLNLKWLRVYSTDGRVIWLALFQSRPAEFREEIRRFAPPNSPVLRFL